MTRNSAIFFASALLWLFLYFMGTYEWTAIGLAITLYYSIKVIYQMGESIPIPDIMLAMMALQWILGPHIEYTNNFSHWKFKMWVDETTYMSYVVPTIALFRVGLYIFPVKTDLTEISDRARHLVSEFPYLPYYLIAAGFILPWLGGFLPAALGFVFYLLGNLKYIGSIYLLFSEKPNRIPVFFGVMAFTAVGSIAVGMFHDLLLWSILTFTFIANEFKLRFVPKIIISVLGLFFALTIQGVKSDYRELTWRQGYQGNRTVLFVSLAYESWRSGAIVTPNKDGDMNIRLNQGWIISSIMNHVPDKEDYANGETIKEAIYAAIVPRLLDPNKKTAGGRENFRRFTGQEIGEGTSMGISLAGEGYANYGRYGGMVFMFLWGVFFGWFWQRMDRLSLIYPTLLIWSPIIFLQVVKAETEFVIVLNHLIKSSVVVFGVLWGIKRYLGIRV